MTNGRSGRATLAGTLPCLLLLGAGLACSRASVRPADGVTPISPSMVGEAASTGQGVFGEWVAAGGLKRFYSLHVPPSYDGSRAWPLILVFHGANNDQHLAEDVGMLEAADRDGYIVASPFGVNSWALYCGGCTPADAAGVDDVGFVATLVDTLSSHLNIDRDRVYAAGLSDGGSFVNRLACQYPLTGAAIVAGTMFLPQQLCRPPRDVSVIGFHGTNDTIIHVYTAWIPINMWAHFDDCETTALVTPLPDTSADGTTVSRYDFPGCRNGTDVVFFAIENGGHNWPGVGPGIGLVTHDIDATEEIMKFFSAHPGTP